MHALPLRKAAGEWGQHTCSGDYSQVPEECPPAIAELIEHCMERPPDGRPSAREAYDVIRDAIAAQTPCQVHLPRSRPQHISRAETFPRGDLEHVQKSPCMHALTGKACWSQNSSPVPPCSSAQDFQ
jgi:serine/threonine protein kinase